MKVKISAYCNESDSSFTPIRIDLDYSGRIIKVYQNNGVIHDTITGCIDLDISIENISP